MGGPPEKAAARPRPSLIEIPEEIQQRAVMARTRLGNVMLAECPSYGVLPDFPRRDVVVAAAPMASIVCPACGITLPVAEQTRCPKMRSGAEALKLLMPPELLHEEMA